MRIFHLANHCEGGGNVCAAIDLACTQSGSGHDVIFASGGGRHEELLARSGVAHLKVVQSFRAPVTAVRSALQIVRACKLSRAEVIHAHMVSGALHGFIASRACRIPLITTVHNSFDRHSRLMRCGDRVVAVSNAEYSLLLSRGFRAERLEMVLNGTIGSPRDDLEPGRQLVLQRPCIMSLSGLERRKGVHDLIEAFRLAVPHARDWHLYIAGDGPERTALEDQAIAADLRARVTFLGQVDSSYPMLIQSDIFVLASYAEPFGLTVCEARHAGCAVVGTRVGGISEQLEDGRFGRLVEPGCPRALAHELRALMCDPRALEDGKRRSRMDLGRYAVSRVSEDYVSVYARALRSYPR
jgi:glycosyltransferase involved in cell wall biosynthesis